eukprot:gene107-20360_t
MSEERAVTNPIYSGDGEGGGSSGVLFGGGSGSSSAKPEPGAATMSGTVKIVGGVMALAIVGLVVALALLASGTAGAATPPDACSCAEGDGLVSASATGAPPAHPPPPPTFTRIPDGSSLILTGDDGARVDAFLPKQIEDVLGSQYLADSTRWELLYRATRDGFKASTFHSLCDGDFATIHVVNSTNGHVFGGVNGVGWHGDVGYQFVNTDKAFVYGIRTHGSPDAAVVFLPTKNLHWGFEQQPESLAAWGGGHALKISDNANLPSEQAGNRCQGVCPGMSNSHSNIGASTATYTGNGITSHDTDASHKYLTGEWHFSVSEVEVYKIVPAIYSSDLISGPDLGAAPVSASAGGDAAAAIDDSFGTEWSEGSVATAAGAWFAVEFGSAVEIRKVTIRTGSGNNACTDIDVEYYDGSAWVVAQNIRPGADDAVHTFAVAASSASTKWRLVSKMSPAAPYSWTIREVEMMKLFGFIDGAEAFSPIDCVSSRRCPPLDAHLAVTFSTDGPDFVDLLAQVRLLIIINDGFDCADVATNWSGGGHPVDAFNVDWYYYNPPTWHIFGKWSGIMCFGGGYDKSGSDDWEDLYLHIPAGKPACDAVAREFNLLPGVSGVICESAGYLYVPDGQLGDTQCNAVASALNLLPGLSGVDCDGDDVHHLLRVPAGATECNAVASALNSIV